MTRSELADSLAPFLEQHSKLDGDVAQRIARTIRILRDCGFEIESAPNRPYKLVESTFPVLLSGEQRQALAKAVHLLSQMNFSTEAGYLSRMTNIDRELESQVQADFHPPVDYGDPKLAETVAKLEERIEQQCRYTIRYRSSAGLEWQWDCDISELRFHEGTLYLFAHVPAFRAKHILDKPSPEQNQLFRIDRILSVGASAPTAWTRLRFPTVTIRYRLTGALKNYQPRRGETVIQRDRDAGFVEMESEVDYLFWLKQRILKYGRSVCVSSPDWFAASIENELQQTLSYYQKQS